LTTPPTILGLDPGTRFLGAAVLRGGKLLAYGVHELRNGQHPHDVIGHAKRVVLRYLEVNEPQVVAIEAPYLIATKRGAVLSTLCQELHERTKELGFTVRESSPEEVRRAITGDSRATKYDVARALVNHFPELKELAPNKPKIPALWLTSRDRYWLHVFDALAIAHSIDS